MSEQIDTVGKVEDTISTEERLWNRNFILLLQGQMVSMFGNTIYDTALRFWILTHTGSTAMMGALLAASVIPEIFMSPFVGTYIDRSDRKRILVIMDIISGSAILFIGIAAILGFIQVWMILPVSLIVGISSCFFNPTIDSSIPDIVPKTKLIKANSLFSSISSGNDMAGYALGSFLIQLLGTPILFIFNGISFLFSAVTECFISIPEINKDLEKTTFWDDMKSGIKFILNSRGLMYLYITTSVLNLCAAMSMTLTLPWFESNTKLGIVSYGIAMAVNTFGMFVGFSALSVFEIKRERRFIVFIISGVLIAITMIIYSFSLDFYIILVMFFVNGICLAVINSLIQSSMQRSVTADMRAKVFSFRRTLSSSLMPIGMVLAGILAEKLKINLIILVDYTVFLLLFIHLAFVSSVKELINI